MNPPRHHKVLYTGGARSGKSLRAQRDAEQLGQRRLFVATAEGRDEDMRARIAQHQRDRGGGWSTAENPRNPAAVIVSRAGEFDVVLLDCLTLWMSNLVCAELDDAALCASIDELAEAITGAPCHLLVVTNEVGLGLVPDNALSRRYRDWLGRANQGVAQACDCVALLVAGQALCAKGELP